MKSIYTLVLLVLVGSLSLSAQHTITNSGYTYNPDSLAANAGDQVTFNMDFSTHPLHEVRDTTWAANGSAQLAGGFSATSGVTTTITLSQPGIRYYVCSNHVGQGMKGRIFVSAINGIQNIPYVAATTFPNPASNQLHIIVGPVGEVHSMLIDILGNTVLQKDEVVSGKGVITLDISSVADGTYILSTVSADGASRRSKVQIVH